MSAFSAEGDFVPRPLAAPLRADALKDLLFGRLIAEAVEELFWAPPNERLSLGVSHRSRIDSATTLSRFYRYARSPGGQLFQQPQPEGDIRARRQLSRHSLALYMVTLRFSGFGNSRCAMSISNISCASVQASISWISSGGSDFHRSSSLIFR